MRKMKLAFFPKITVALAIPSACLALTASAHEKIAFRARTDEECIKKVIAHEIGRSPFPDIVVDDVKIGFFTIEYEGRDKKNARFHGTVDISFYFYPGPPLPPKNGGSAASDVFCSLNDSGRLPSLFTGEVPSMFTIKNRGDSTIYARPHPVGPPPYL